MAKHLEIEYKTLLSMPEYERLMQRFSHIKPVRQTNHYFDTQSLGLREKRLALRIRTFNDHAEMTLKVPQEVGNIEYNIVLPLEDAQTVIESKSLLSCATDLSEIFEVLEGRDVTTSDIIYIGCLTTVRREYQLPIGLGALDSNHFLGMSDYEFELEVEDDTQGKQDFSDFLVDNDIEFRYARSKVVRFLDTLRHQKK